MLELATIARPIETPSRLVFQHQALVEYRTLGFASSYLAQELRSSVTGSRGRSFPTSAATCMGRQLSRCSAGWSPPPVLRCASTSSPSSRHTSAKCDARCAAACFTSLQSAGYADQDTLETVFEESFLPYFCKCGFFSVGDCPQKRRLRCCLLPWMRCRSFGVAKSRVRFDCMSPRWKVLSRTDFLTYKVSRFMAFLLCFLVNSTKELTTPDAKPRS